MPKNKLNEPGPSVNTKLPFAPLAENSASGVNAPCPDVSAKSKVSTENDLGDGRSGTSLIAITRQLHQFELDLLENGGELSPEFEEVISAVSIARDRKAEAYFHLIERMNGVSNEFKRKAAMMDLIASGATSIIKKLKANLKFAMESNELTEMPGETIVFKTTKPSEKLDVENEDLIPDEYFDRIETITHVLNQEKVLADLKNGIEIPGAKIKLTRQLRHYPLKKG
jgi:hypothetical protein